MPTLIDDFLVPDRRQRYNYDSGGWGVYLDTKLYSLITAEAVQSSFFQARTLQLDLKRLR